MADPAIARLLARGIRFQFGDPPSSGQTRTDWGEGVADWLDAQDAPDPAIGSEYTLVKDGRKVEVLVATGSGTYICRVRDAVVRQKGRNEPVLAEVEPDELVEIREELEAFGL